MPSRHIWPLYALLLSALAWVFFADVLTLGLHTHDVETFRDHERWITALNSWSQTAAIGQ